MFFNGCNIIFVFFVTYLLLLSSYALANTEVQDKLISKLIPIMTNRCVKNLNLIAK
jgi:hypothetical protein